MQCLDFLSDLNCPCYAYIPWIWCCRLSYTLRLSDIWTFALVWMSESYYIIVTDILWQFLHSNTRVTDQTASISALSLQLSFSPLNLECAACLGSRFDTVHHYDYALPCNWTHNIRTLNMQSWPRLQPVPVQILNGHTHSEPSMIHIKTI